MRRKLQAMSNEQISEILTHATAGVLSLYGEDGYPYGVPLTPTYIPTTNTIYFHGALVGHKIDCIAHHPKASFTIIDQDIVVPGALTTLFRSVIAFGTVKMLTANEEKLAALQAIGQQYSLGHDEHVAKVIDRELSITSVFAFQIESITGKESRGVLEARKMGRTMSEQSQYMEEHLD